MESKDIVYVSSNIVKCEGQAYAIGHPLVYLEIKNEQIICPYCSKIFRIKNHENNLHS